jgi:hypothetical protein
MTATVVLDLEPRHRAMLQASAIADATIAARGYISIPAGAVQTVHDLPGAAHSTQILKKVLHQGALAFPVYRCGDGSPSTWVLRPDLPRTNKQGKVIKYEYPASVPNILDVLPQYRDALGDPSIPLWFTEGAKKADALASAFGEAIVPVNLNGVYGWRGTNPAGGKTNLPDLREVALNGREIVLAFDSDVKTNKQVRGALMEFARVLTARGASAVRFVALPDGPDGAKVGVDDFLAQGHTSDDVRALLTNLAIIQNTARVPLLAHPDTGAELFLPFGYDVQHQQIVKVGQRGDAMPIYAGNIYVRSLGTDLGTGEEAATVSWHGSAHGILALPRTDLANARALRDRLAARGALIHDGNAKLLAAYLVEFIGQNVDELPRVAVTSRLGVHDDALVLPGGSIGGDGPVMYQSVKPIRVGDDSTAYPETLRAMMGWDDFSIPSLILGLALAAPMIARIRPRRNPALYLAGPSSSGKTTLIQFAVGAWGDPTVTPFRIEATRTSTAGYLQTLADLGGLPLFVDEAHTAQFPDRLESLAYNFANGQSYTKGTTTGHAGGGELLSGALLMAGEARVEFMHSGSRNRVLWLDGHRWSPMGTFDPEQGGAHAKQLEAAWERGCGRFGPMLAEAVWRDWESFTSDVENLRIGDAVRLAPAAWQHTLAIGMASLRAAMEIAGSPLGDTDAAALLAQWAALLAQGHTEADPAADAFESLVLLIVGATDEPFAPAGPGWKVRTVNREPIAYMREGEDVWRVPTRTNALRERIGHAAVQLYGQTWVARGWVEADGEGRCTHVNKIGGEGAVRVLRIPTERLNDWRPDEPTAGV